MTPGSSTQRKSLHLHMSPRAALLALCAPTLALQLGCKPEAKTPPAATNQGAATRAAHTPNNPHTTTATGATFRPPPLVFARPAMVRGRRVAAEEVGTLTEGSKPDAPRVLRGVGMTRCRDSWAFQGFYTETRTPGERVKATPHIVLQRTTLPVGAPVTYVDPRNKGQTVKLDLKHATRDRLEGTIQLIGPRGDTIRTLTIKPSRPTHVAAGPGIGTLGCFTTGYYRMTTDQTIHARGGGVAFWDQRSLYSTMLQLTPDHALTIMVILTDQQRKRGISFDQLDLAETLKHPKRYPIRVFFEQRKAAEPKHLDPGTTAPSVDAWTPFMVGEGKVSFRFGSSQKEGPVEVLLSGIKLPDAPGWTGPMAGAKLGEVRAQVHVIHERTGTLVPIPRPPGWWNR